MVPMKEVFRATTLIVLEDQGNRHLVNSEALMLKPVMDIPVVDRMAKIKDTQMEVPDKTGIKAFHLVITAQIDLMEEARAIQVVDHEEMVEGLPMTQVTFLMPAEEEALETQVVLLEVMVTRVVDLMGLEALDIKGSKTLLISIIKKTTVQFSV